MSEHRKHLENQLAEAERELDAATRPSEIRAAATKRRLALQGLQGLQWLEEQEKTGRPSRGRGSDRESQG